MIIFTKSRLPPTLPPPVVLFVTLAIVEIIFSNIDATPTAQPNQHANLSTSEHLVEDTHQNQLSETTSHGNTSNNITSLINLTTINQSHGNESNASQEFLDHVTVPPVVPVANRSSTRHRSKNYASSECAKVIDNNPEAKKTSHIINEMIDEYMLNPCKTKIWFVIELCEIIQATQIEIANYELYSSTPKDFTVYFSDIYPALDWKPIGHFTASDSRTLQIFDLDQVGFGKFIRVEFHSHYGNEHYCVISEVKVYGESMVDEYEKSEKVTIQNGQAKHSNRKFKRKTSAWRVYRNMMVEPHVCGLSFDVSDSNYLIKNETTNQSFYPHREQPIKPILPSQPAQQPVATSKNPVPLKPSIFVELSNKVKALETLLKFQLEDIERRLNERKDMERRTEAKVDKLKLQFESFALIMIAYYVYKMMLDLM